MESTPFFTPQQRIVNKLLTFRSTLSGFKWVDTYSRNCNLRLLVSCEVAKTMLPFSSWVYIASTVHSTFLLGNSLTAFTLINNCLKTAIGIIHSSLFLHPLLPPVLLTGVYSSDSGVGKSTLIQNRVNTISEPCFILYVFIRHKNFSTFSYKQDSQAVTTLPNNTKPLYSAQF